MQTPHRENRTAEHFLAPLVEVEELPCPIVSRASEYPSDFLIPPHRHRRAQLVYASAGVMTVSTAAGLWVVPPQRAVWVPALTTHHIHTAGRLSMRSLYIVPEAARQLPQTCCVVVVTPLLRELILYAMTLPPLYAPDSPAERLMRVLLDQLQQAPVAPLHVPMPTHEHLQPIVRALTDNPADGRRLEDWARLVGVSSRTLARDFHEETGISFRHWRQQVRLLAALKRLACQEQVTMVALELGYDSPSAFIAMFKRALGVTPGQYFAGTSCAALPE
ncbi:MAG: helix-turn-helix transcriptional regulator [Candidatus Tectimicrobiota bacterium]